MSWGWDPATRVWTVDPGQSVFRYRKCAVAGCDRDVTARGNLCNGCEPRRRASGLSIEEFVSQPVSRERWQAEQLCRVCRSPGHLRPTSTNGLCLACEALRRRRHQPVEAFLAGDGRFAAACPRPTMGTCAVGTCERLAAYRRGLCHGHQRWWLDAGQPELASWCASAEPLCGDRRSRISLVGVSDGFEVEFLFGVQSAVKHGHRLRPADLRSVIGWARREGSDSFEAFMGAPLNPASRRFITRTVDAIEVAAKTPESECEKDVWDLRVWGFKGQLSFVGGRPLNHPGHRRAEPIRQVWLRDAAKRWASSRLPLGRSESTVEAVLAAVGRWSAHLARRADRGEDPTALGKQDITSFLAALRVQVDQERLHPYMHARTVQFLRRFLRDCRDLGPDERAAGLAGLPSAVAVAREEVPLAPRDDPGAEVGDAIPDAVLVQLLDEHNLGLLSPDARRRFEIGLEVGRRPGELCRLAFGCLAHDERINEAGGTEIRPVLVHDMHKVNVVGCRLPIHQSTADLIIEQQEAVRARFPNTLGAELVLFPAVQRDKGGRRPVSATGWATEMRNWVNRLELFEGHLDPDGGLHVLQGASGTPVRFDSARVFPYALRHTYAQRHVNAGTPVEVLKELLGHDRLDTTSGYYRISSERKRNAVKSVMPLQLTVSGARLRLVGDPTDSDLSSYALSQVAVPMGSCVEPSNVRANGNACDFRYRCLGCSHFRSDPSYLPELRAYLTKLLAARERLAASVPALADWARREASPSDEEIDAVRALITACESALAQLDPDDRGSVEEAIEVLRQGRAGMDTTFPVQFLGVVAPPSPVLFPRIVAEAGRLR